MEELNDCCEVLLEQCAFIEVREDSAQAQERYSKLAAIIHGETTTFMAMKIFPLPRYLQHYQLPTYLLYLPSFCNKGGKTSGGTFEFPTLQGTT